MEKLVEGPSMFETDKDIGSSGAVRFGYDIFGFWFGSENLSTYPSIIDIILIWTKYQSSKNNNTQSKFIF